jgi:hypothetical protein
MGKPLYKVEHHKEQQQLDGHGQTGEIKDLQTFWGEVHFTKKYGQQFIKTTDDNSENEKVEEHIEGIQPKILPKDRLVPTPWKQHFQHPDNQGNGYKAPEIIEVPWHLKDYGFPGPLHGPRKGGGKGIPIFFHNNDRIHKTNPNYILP